MTHVIDVYAVHSYPGGYEVSLKPPLSDGVDRSCRIADLGRALAYARVLRLEYGFPITGAVMTNVVSFNGVRGSRVASLATKGRAK